MSLFFRVALVLCVAAVLCGIAGTAQAGCHVACGQVAVASVPTAFVAPVAVQSFAYPSVAVLATPVVVQQAVVVKNHHHANVVVQKTVVRHGRTVTVTKVRR